MIKKDNLFSAGGMTQSDRCIHTPGSFAKQNLLYVQEVGRLQSLKPHRCIREKLDSYLFFVVLEGKGDLDIKGKHYKLSCGDCVLVDCMEHYEHISDEQDAWKLAWVHFNGAAAKNYYELFMKCNEESNVFYGGKPESWDDVIGKLLIRQKERNFQAELYCGELLLHLLNCVIYGVSNISVMASETEKQRGNELRELLNEQYATKEVLETAGKHFGLELSVLESEFSGQFGISMEEYICNRRFNAAKELLRFSIKPIDEVAEESGFDDVNILQQLFIEKEGMTAEEYRARWAAWIR